MKKRYVISFGGLSAGKHEYEYNLTDTFFESLDYSEIKKGDVRVDVRLNKQTTMLALDFIVRGTAITACDRCGDDCTVTIKGEYPLIVNLGSEFDDQGDELVTIPNTEGELDIAHYLYEYTMLSLPSRKVHEKEEDCNQEVIKKLKEIEVADAQQAPGDPRWEVLKNLKFNN